MTASLQSLKTLKVRGCKHLTMHAVRSIINNVPYLEVGERGRETSHRQSPTDHHRACVDKWSRDVVAHADAGVFLAGSWASVRSWTPWRAIGYRGWRRRGRWCAA